VVQISSKYFKSLSEESHDGISYLEEFAIKSGCTVDDLIRELFLQPKEVPLKYRFPKREKQKLRAVWYIVSNLPATFSVLQKKSRFAKGTLSKYLRKLERIEVILKEINLYRLNDGLHRERNGKREILWSAIVNRWYHQPEYEILKASKIYREALRGRKRAKSKVTKSTLRTRKKKIDKLRKIALG